MLRLYRLCLFALTFVTATLLTDYTYAQTPVRTTAPTVAPTAAIGEQSPTPRAQGIAATVTAIQATATPTNNTAPNASSAQNQNSPLLLPTPTPAASTNTDTTAQTTPVGATNATTATVDEATGPLEGTIFANRSEVLVTFFLEGQTYQLVAGRSHGVQLPRPSTVLNLFNCAGDLPADTAGCFWDPYMIQQDGFYEFYNTAAATEPAKLMLREAGAPPTGQVWVQNRTGQVESVVFKEEIFDIQPSSVQEFPVSTGVPAILYVRSCLTVDNQSACEWAPKTLDAGIYYAMLEVDTTGSQGSTTTTTIDLRPVVGASEGGNEQASSAEVATADSQSIVCNVVVPALNVRSGPGLQYDIIGKVRTIDGTAVTVSVTGRSIDNEWLTVTDAVAVGGWINNSPSFITCVADVTSLPIVESPALPTPAPVVIVETPAVVEQPVQDVATPEAPAVVETPVAEDEQPVAEETSTPAAAEGAIPVGQALLIINNGFQHDMRFTLDQVYRVAEGPSEFDLSPGASISLVVHPGNIPFSASSPWSGLSGNASINVGPDESYTLWLRFEPDNDDSWKFAWD